MSKTLPIRITIGDDVELEAQIAEADYANLVEAARKQEEDEEEDARPPSLATQVENRARLIRQRENGGDKALAIFSWLVASTGDEDGYREKARAELASEQTGYLADLPAFARYSFMSWYRPRMKGRTPTQALVDLAKRTTAEGQYERVLLLHEVFGEDDVAEASDVIEKILSDLDEQAEVEG
jgi:hypothetical protein